MKAKTPNITIAAIKSRFTYNPATGVLTSNATGRRAGWLDHGYVRIQIGKEMIYAHRVVWAIVHGKWPDEEIDHINGDRLDNRVKNLRSVSRSTNMHNKKKYSSNSSGVTGVYWYKPTKRWVAMIGHKGRLVSLGYFTDIQDAINARKHAEKNIEAFTKSHGRRN